MSDLIRLQLGFPNAFSFINPSNYLQFVTMHGLIMVVYLLTALFLGGFIVNTRGLIGAVLGGGTATNLANSGEDYERFYRTAQEVAAATWLGSEARPGQLVYADRYAELSLAAMTELGSTVIQDVTPLTINQHAWVYASTSNIVDGRARAVFGVWSANEFR